MIVVLSLFMVVYPLEDNWGKWKKGHGEQNAGR